MPCFDCILHKALTRAVSSSVMPLTPSIVAAMIQEYVFQPRSQQRVQHAKLSSWAGMNQLSKKAHESLSWRCLEQPIATSGLSSTALGNIDCAQKMAATVCKMKRHACNTYAVNMQSCKHAM